MTCATCQHARWSAQPLGNRGLCAAKGYPLGRLLWIRRETEACDRYADTSPPLDRRGEHTAGADGHGAGEVAASLGNLDTTKA